METLTELGCKVTREDLAVLYNARTDRYSRVFPYGNGRKGYKVKIGTEYVGDFREKRLGAIAVVQYFKKRYGSHWKEVAKRGISHSNPYCVRKGRQQRERGRYLWIAEVHVTGDVILVTNKTVSTKGWLGDGWESREAATKACKAMRDRLGSLDLQGRPLLLRVRSHP